MELKRDNVALLDKVCVYNFQISKVENYDYLLEAGIIIVKEKQKNYIEIAGPGQYISSIRIKKTKYFDSFLLRWEKMDIHMAEWRCQLMTQSITTLIALQQ